MRLQLERALPPGLRHSALQKRALADANHGSRLAIRGPLSACLQVLITLVGCDLGGSFGWAVPGRLLAGSWPAPGRLQSKRIH